MTDIINSIRAINPKAEVTVQAEDIKKITWHNGTTPISEEDILAKQKELQSKVWGYHSELETHTVETHIYRLRKKIQKVFADENFIISDKDGYKINKKK